MVYKRQIKEIQITDRSFISSGDYTAFEAAHAGGNLARSGCGGRAERQRAHHALQPEPGAATRCLARDSSIAAATRTSRSIPASSSRSQPAWAAARCSSAAGRWKRTSRCSATPTTTRTASNRNDLYQGRTVSQGGRFCDQRDFDIPFMHEFKLAGNYSLPSAWTSARW